VSVRRLARPREVSVRAGGAGIPTEVEGEPVDSVLEEWVVEDRWWSGRPVRRRYFELVLSGGRNAVVFREIGGGRAYFEHRGPRRR
jgi:hypothetical protein